METENDDASSIAEQVQSLKKSGNDRYSKRDYEKAIEFYSKGIAIDPTSHLLFANRCAAHLRLKDFEKAANDAKECIKLNEAFVKGYTRLSEAYCYMNHFDEAEEVILQAEKIEPENQTLKILRESIGSKRVFSMLKGPWYGTVNKDFGGYLQTFNFVSESSVIVGVFGREMKGSLKICSQKNGEPGHLDILINPGNGQPLPPEILHIFKFENNGNELHLCSPFMTPTDVRPTVFEGPAHIVMYRGTPPVDHGLGAERKKIEAMDRGSRCISFAEKVMEIIPNITFTPEMEANPQSEEMRLATLASVNFENEYFKARQLYGEDTEAEIQTYLSETAPCSDPRVNEVIGKLRKRMQEAGMLADETQTEASRAERASSSTHNASCSDTAPVSAEDVTPPAAIKMTTSAVSASPIKAELSVSEEQAKSSLMGITKAKDNLGMIIAIGVIAIAATGIALFVLNRKK